MADKGMEKRSLEAREGERERERERGGREKNRRRREKKERRPGDREREGRGEGGKTREKKGREERRGREGGREETHTYTYLKVVVIQEQSGEVCKSPQLRTQVSDWSSYLQLCPMRSFRVITILSYHFAIQSS